MEKLLLERSPEVEPLLSRLHDRHKLYELAKDKEPAARSELADIMADLLSFELSEREKELLADVMIGLLRQAEMDLRRALADRLATKDNVPLRVILSLANDDIYVAESVLRKSPILQDMDLVYLIKSQGVGHWQAIARRAGLNASVINLLAEKRDIGTAIALSENNDIVLTNLAISIFVEMSKTSEALARPLLMRDELPGIIGQMLYTYVGEEIKAVIRERFPLHAEVIEPQLDDIIIDFVDSAADGKMPQASPEAIAEAQIKARKNDIRFDDLMQSLKRGQLGAFTALFAEYFGLPMAIAHDLLQQENGQGLAIACKAKEIQKGDFIALFLLVQKARFGGSNIVKHQDLARASAYFDKVTLDLARKILSESRN